MKTVSWRPWVGALALALAGIQPALAGTVTFESAPVGLDSLFEHGQSFSSEGFLFTPTSGFNLPAVGALVGAINDAGSALIGLQPTNVDGRYYAGYNDGALTMSTGNGRALLLSGFDFSFMPFAGGFYGLGDVPGALVASYVAFDGSTGLETFLFGAADAAGAFAYSTVSGAALGALAGPLNSVSFFACVVENGFCVNPSSFGDAWFALDNIRAEVPVPSTLPLVALALVCAGALRTRPPEAL